MWDGGKPFQWKAFDLAIGMGYKVCIGSGSVCAIEWARFDSRKGTLELRLVIFPISFPVMFAPWRLCKRFPLSRLLSPKR